MTLCSLYIVGVVGRYLTFDPDVYFPEQRHVHGSETVQGETFPNLYTLRGTAYGTWRSGWRG